MSINTRGRDFQPLLLRDRFFLSQVALGSSKGRATRPGLLLFASYRRLRPLKWSMVLSRRPSPNHRYKHRVALSSTAIASFEIFRRPMIISFTVCFYTNRACASESCRDDAKVLRKSLDFASGHLSAYRREEITGKIEDFCNDWQIPFPRETPQAYVHYSTPHPGN